MSITALYVFTHSRFTVSQPATIEYLSRKPPGSGPPGDYTVKSKAVSDSFELDPTAYRIPDGVSVTPDATTAAGRAGEFKLVPLANKGEWPDPPANAASEALGIPMDVLKDFYADVGTQSVLDA